MLAHSWLSQQLISILLMMSTKNTLASSFKFAFEGLKTAAKQEPNFKIHVSAGIIALLFAIILGFTPVEWVLLLITISFVLLFELLNTVLEAMVDLVSPKIQPSARVAKDVSAAAVLMASITAVAVGIALFLPKILLLLTTSLG